MKILIVDDQPRRYDRLVRAFRDLGIEREQIEIVVSAMDARDKIKAQTFDLMILDILLPLRPEEELTAQAAIDLLFEIQEADLSNAPRHILGITADRAVAQDALKQFEDWCWTILDYSASDDEWVTRAANCARYVKDKATESIVEAERPDLAIVCALRDPELSEVLKLPWNWGVSRPIDDLRFVHDGFVNVGGRRITVCATAAPRMGMVATALHSAALITHLRPRILAMTGVCAGVQGKARMGDVLFADTAWDCQNGKRIKDKGNGETRLAQRPHHLPADSKIRSHIEQIRDDKDGLTKMMTAFPGTPPGVSRVLIGPVASGSAVLADGKSVAEIREQQQQDMIGVEMEIYGLYAAAHSATGRQPLSFAIKGVCDFGDPEKDDEHQHYAAYASARVLQMLIERFGSRFLD
jgi:nucleoside phosphorylase/CheY-like chemotaxis protein